MNDRTDGTDFFSRARGSIAFRIAAALLLIAVCAILFFSCRDDSAADRSPGFSPQPAASPTESGSSAEAGLFGKKAFADGTYIGGIDVSGMTADEARSVLDEKAELMKGEYSFRFTHEKGGYLLDRFDLNLKANTAEIIELAMKNGGGEYELELKPLNDSRLRAAIAGIAEKVNRAPVEPELMSAAAARETGLDELERNARFVVTAPVDGFSVDEARAAELVLEGKTEAALPVKSIPAEGKAPSLPVRRAFFSTSFNSYSLSLPGRVHNIKKAAALINGRALESGEELSCNAALGERTKENGWQTATAFASGGRETEQQYGGGICQVSTTLYNCALMAGLEVPERIGHSRKVAYIDGGRDASLSWGSADLVIKNSTDERIYIFMWTDDEKNCLMCEIYGEAFPAEYDKIEIITELVEVNEPTEPEFTADPTLKEGECVRIRNAIRGRVYQTYLEYKKNGDIVNRKKEAVTAYPMIPALYATAGDKRG